MRRSLTNSIPAKAESKYSDREYIRVIEVGGEARRAKGNLSRAIAAWMDEHKDLISNNSISPKPLIFMVIFPGLSALDPAGVER